MSLKSSFYCNWRSRLPPLPKTRTEIWVEGDWTKTLTRENFLFCDNDDSNKILIFGKQGSFPSSISPMWMVPSPPVLPYFTISSQSMAFLTVSSYNRFFTIMKEEIQNSDLTLQPSAVMADFELALIQASCIVSDNYMLSLNILVQIQNVLDIMTIRHFGIRPCGKAL